MEFFYIGIEEPRRVEDALREAFFLLPRGEIDEELGTDIRMNSVEEGPRYFTEEMDVTQGNLAMGFRLGECMEDTDDVTLRTFNTLFGSGPSSRLFRNVRERMSLCYYASSSLDFHKGILTVSSGIDFDKYDAVREEILAQLDAVRRGEFSDDELETAKATTGAYLRLVPDSLTGMESFYTAQIVRGMDASPEDHLALLEDVTKDDVIRVAQSVELDAVYFLRGEAKE
jgi:predicted Zn-dependent peptidase